MTFPTGYVKYQEIVIDNTKVSSTEVDFPILVDLSDMVKTGNDIFDACRTDGGDIRVTLNDGTTQLAREVVSIDTTAKTGELHIKIPSLSSSTDTTIFIWYNGIDAEPLEDSIYGKENTWNSGYKMVQHMNQDPSGTAPQMIDSTSNDNDGTSGGMDSGDLVDGKIGKALNFDGVNDYMELTPIVDVSSSSYSYEAWFYIDTLKDYNYVMESNGIDGDEFIISVRINSAGILQVSSKSDTESLVITAQTTINAEEWYHIVVTYDSSTREYIIYINGQLDSSDTITGTILKTPTYLHIGADRSKQSVRFFDGLIDEVSISNVTLSAGWIATKHNNQNSPSTFYSVSEEVSAFETTLFDGKVNIILSDTDLLDSKTIIKNNDINLFDGLIEISDNNTDLLDSKTTIQNNAIDLFDGKIVVKSEDEDFFDAKVKVSTNSIDLFDGKLIITSTLDEIEYIMYITKQSEKTIYIKRKEEITLNI